MNKSPLLLALLSTALSPFGAQAASSVYGSIRLVASVVDYNDKTNDTDDQGISLDNSDSRFGLRGSEELGNGFKIGGRYEFGVAADAASIQDNKRLSYISLEGGFGELQAGRVWSSYWNATGDAWPGNDFTGDGNVTTRRISDAIKWTKALGGAKFSLMGVFKDGLQRTQGSGGISSGGISAAIGFDKKEKSHFHTTLNLGYKTDNGLSLNAILQNRDPDDGTDTVVGYTLIGVYSANKNTFILSYGDKDVDKDNDTVSTSSDDQSVSFEVARKLGDRSLAWVSANNFEHASAILIGLRHDW